VELVGNIPCFCLGHVNSNAIANVLSYAIVSRKLLLFVLLRLRTVLLTLRFTSTHPVIQNIKMFYMKDYFTLTLRDQSEFSQILKVEENEKRFCKRQIKEACTAVCVKPRTTFRL